MRLLTWNINSVRLRLPLLERLAHEVNPDVICLQETKVEDHLFPKDAIAELGFPHQAFAGQKSYNGVAVLSKRPIVTSRVQNWCGRTDCRHLIVSLDGGVELHNIYIPAGGDLPDPEANDKFAHKLSFLEELAQWYGSAYASSDKLILVGDFNVAPLENDVWSHKQMQKIISHTPGEVLRLTRFQDSLGFIDAPRHFVPPDLKLYTWWSYRAADWAASDRGRRLDHVWVTPPLKNALAGSLVVREARGWPQPSDHVPLIVDFYSDEMFSR
ncbi:Exodeoxyribonuclease III [Rhodospirillaceae bacterium LM-1]|nr:Exodeoxyribonuclease III [Rhodospirillaceae bacterium LM-1]